LGLRDDAHTTLRDASQTADIPLIEAANRVMASIQDADHV
jgi:hypothetical protein